VRQLAGFGRVRLEPLATETVEIELPSRRFQVWREGAWQPAAASFRIWVGRSSRDLADAGTVAD
jgi:hypothetical protein